MGVVLAIPANPTTYSGGTYAAAATTLNTGVWRLIITPTQASTAYTGGNYHCLLAGPHGGLWLNDSALEFYTAPGDVTAFSRVMTWSASQALTVTIDTRSGSRGVTIAGATTGSGAFSFSQAGPYFDAADTLYIGRIGSDYIYSGSFSDVTDTLTSRTASGSTAVAAVTSATRTFARAAGGAVAVAAAVSALGVYERSAAGSTAPGAATDATVSGGIERTAAGSSAVDAATAAAGRFERSAAGSSAVAASTAALRELERSASGSSVPGAATAATVTGAVSFGPGVSTSGIWLFGHAGAACVIPGGYLPGGSGPDADGRTPAAINTQASGSTFYLAVARAKATSNKTLTDNKGNTYTLLIRDDYDDGSAWENEIAVCVGGAGGTGHQFSADGVNFDEVTFAADEILKCAYLADYGTSFTASGTTQISPTGIDLKGPGWVYVDWFGDGPTSGSEGSSWTVTAQDEGPTVGSQWQVVDSRIVNHNDGWIQWKRWRRYYATATTGIRLQLASLSPTQGARWYAAAFMEANITSATAAGSTAVTAATSATRTLERSAAGSTAPDVATAAARSFERTLAGSTAAGASTSAIAARARAASSSSGVSVVTSAVKVQERTGSGSTAVDAATAATLVPAGTFEREASGSSAVEVTAAATRILERAAAGASAVLAASSVSAQTARVIRGRLGSLGRRFGLLQLLGEDTMIDLIGPMRVFRGDSLTLRLTVTDDEDERVDITDADIELQVRTAAGATGAPVIQKTVGAGIEILTQADDTLGQADISITSSDTDRAPALHYLDVVVTLGGQRAHVISPRKFSIAGSVTPVS